MPEFCPGGCVNGGGQPQVPASVRNFTDIRAERAKALYNYDENMPVQVSLQDRSGNSPELSFPMLIRNMYVVMPMRVIPEHSWIVPYLKAIPT